MSKDKGQKNIKKAPADKSLGKQKAVSDYKAEGKGGIKQPAFESSGSKPDNKAGGNHKP